MLAIPSGETSNKESLVHIDRRVRLIEGDLRDAASLRKAIDLSRPHEIYNLAAQSNVGVSFKNPDETMEINYYGLGRLLHAVLETNPKIRVFQASTAEIFGNARPPQRETSPRRPVSPYGQSKLFAHEEYVEGYRKRHKLYVVSAFLFNHESPRRPEHFVTRKITASLAKIKLGLEDSFMLGNLDAKRDWGFAGDYVKAMHKMLQQKKPDDFVIATGKSHTVREFVEAAAQALDMPLTWSGTGLKEVAKTKDGRTILTISKEFYRPNEANYFLGDPRKAKRKLGWHAETSFENLAAIMAHADYERLRKSKNKKYV